MSQKKRIKILILGESGVGKSSLLNQYVDGQFNSSHMLTIGVDYKQKLIQLSDGSSLQVQVWDTAGTQRFRTLTPMYYRNCDGFLLVYDITLLKSFQSIDYYVEELNNKSDVANTDLLLIGNKSDLQNKRQVFEESAKQLADKLGILYTQASATKFQETARAFEMLIQRILKRKKSQFLLKKDTLKLEAGKKKQKSKQSSCC